MWQLSAKPAFLLKIDVNYSAIAKYNEIFDEGKVLSYLLSVLLIVRLTVQ